MGKIKHVLRLVILGCLGMLVTGCGATSIETVDPAVAGNWQGACAIDLPIVFDPTELPADVARRQVTVPLLITIHADATVDGMVGAATIEESVVKYNRSELGRSLRMASDYIIIDGHLAGPLVTDQDATAAKAFTIPFDVVDDHLIGGLMWLEPWKYPLPLCQVDLTRRPD